MRKITRNLLLASAVSSLGACAGLPESPGAQQGQAIDQSPQAESVQTEHAPSAYEKGKSALAKGDVGLAIEYFLTAHRQDPESLDGVNALAVAYDMLGRSDLADRYFAKALALAPRDPDILNNVGYAMLKRGDTERARRYLLEAKALSSENEVILSNVAILTAPTDIQEDAGQLAKAEPLPAAAAEVPADRESVALEPAEPLTPVPVAEVAELPLDTPGQPEEPEAPLQAAAIVPPRQSDEAPQPETITWSGERVEPLTRSEPESIGTVEPLQNAALPPRETGAPLQLVSVPIAAPEELEQAAATQPIKLARRVTLQEASLPEDAPLRRPGEADIIAALPSSTPPSSAPEVIEGEPELPLTPMADEAAVVPPRANDLPCDGALDKAAVTLVNGNGREGMAKRTRSQLSMMGLSGDARLQNAAHYRHIESVIRYRGDMYCAAQALASLLLQKPALRRDDAISEDLRVLLGGDLLDFDARYVQTLSTNKTE